MELEWEETVFATEYYAYIWESDRWTGFYWHERDGSQGRVDKISLPRVHARFVFLYLTRSSQPGGGFGLREWRVYGRETANLALGAPADASSNPADAWLAVDGDPGTRWASDPGTAGNQWIRIRLTPPRLVSEYRLYFDEDAFARKYQIVFFAGNEVLPSPEVEAARGGKHTWSFPEPVSADYFMVYATEFSAAGFMALGELELYGPEGLLVAGPRSISAADPGDSSRLRLRPQAGGGRPAATDRPLRWRAFDPGRYVDAGLRLSTEPAEVPADVPVPPADPVTFPAIPAALSSPGE
jgi:hypothetical protein